MDIISMLWNVDSVYAALEQGAKALRPERVGADEAGQPNDEITIAKHISFAFQESKRANLCR